MASGGPAPTYKSPHDIDHKNEAAAITRGPDQVHSELHALGHLCNIKKQVHIFFSLSSCSVLKLIAHVWSSHTQHFLWGPPHRPK